MTPAVVAAERAGIAFTLHEVGLELAPVDLVRLTRARVAAVASAR